MSRTITLEGCSNARDLGGLPTPTGSTRFGALFRSDDIDGLTGADWNVLRTLNVKTIIDLRDPTEIKNPRPEIERVNIPYDGPRDEPFWERWSTDSFALGCAIYYPDQLETYPELSVQVLEICATREPVWFHCMGGCDRTGLVSLLVLRLLGVEENAIVEDYLSSDAIAERQNVVAELQKQNKTVESVFRDAFVAADAFIKTLPSGLVQQLRNKLL